MQDTAIMDIAPTATTQIIKQAINGWAGQNKTINNIFSKHADEVYMNEAAPGRNRGIYLLGHLIATNDGMLPLFGLGDRLFPELEAIFITAPDKTVAELPSLAELKDKWAILNTALAGHFDEMNEHEWLSRHTKVSAEDFAAEPMRNKLNVLMGRTAHQSYHAGQLAFLAPKN